MAGRATKSINENCRLLFWTGNVRLVMEAKWNRDVLKVLHQRSSQVKKDPKKIRSWYKRIRIQRQLAARMDPLSLYAYQKSLVQSEKPT